MQYFGKQKFYDKPIFLSIQHFLSIACYFNKTCNCSVDNFLVKYSIIQKNGSSGNKLHWWITFFQYALTKHKKGAKSKKSF